MNASLKRAMAWGLLRSGALSLHRTGFERGRAIVLLYHRVNDERDPFFPSTPIAQFTGQIEYLARRYRIEPYESVLDWLDRGAPGRPRVAITFDDGYPDTHDVVLPVLERLGLPATLFLSTAPPETGVALWTDRVRSMFKHTRATAVHLSTLGLALDLKDRGARLAALGKALPGMKRSPPVRLATVIAEVAERLGNGLPAPSALSWDQVRRLVRDGAFGLGAHTHNHYLLSWLPDADLHYEIETSVRLIQERTGMTVASFAYPNGESEDYDGRAIEVLRRLGLRSGATCRLGFVYPAQDRHHLARISGSEPFLALFAARTAGLSPEIRQSSR